MSADTPVFTLSYETELRDLTEMARLDPRRKKIRRRAVLSVPPYVIIVGALTALSVALTRPSVVGQETPVWMYVLDTLGWLIVLYLLRVVWRLGPAACGRRIWRTRPAFRGPHREEVSATGILTLAPGQPSVFFRWLNLTTIEETTRAFYVRDGTGSVVVLPKRGLPDASLIPELRQFLHQAVARRPADGDQPPAGADQAVATD